MERMIQGTEHEYTLYSRRMNGLGLDPHIIGLELLMRSDLHCAGDFLLNGSRAYYDVGHLEISTCETSNFRDLLTWEKAGEKILDWVRRVMEEKYCSKDMRIWAFKNNTSPDGTSYGSHENYCVSRDIQFPERFLKELVPHLTTRFIYTGAGDIIDGKYVLSPSVYLTSHLVSGETMRDTGVLNTRDEPHSSTHRRLHLLIGDALLSEPAILLRQFTTSAVLRLMENDSLSDVPKLASPLEDMWHNVERTNPDQWRIHLKDGTTTSPIEIQRFYLSKIESLVESDEERRALRLLEEILDGLEEKRSRELSRRVEWIDRYFAIQEAKEGRHGLNVEMTVCKQYSEVGQSIYHRRLRAGLLERITTDDEIVRAIREPPEDTRASLRRALCDSYDVESIDWAVAVINDGNLRRIELPDPYATELETYVAG